VRQWKHEAQIWKAKDEASVAVVIGARAAMHGGI